MTSTDSWKMCAEALESVLVIDRCVTGMPLPNKFEVEKTRQITMSDLERMSFSFLENDYFLSRTLICWFDGIEVLGPYGIIHVSE